MKMLTTQISGLLQRIATTNENAIEETARLLAQATTGEGQIIFAGFDEMELLTTTAIRGSEPFEHVIPFTENMDISNADRIWILTRSSTNTQALQLAQRLADSFIPFAVLAAEKPNDDNELASLSYTYISTGILKGMLPREDGERIVQPHALAALFVYEAVKMAYDEIIADDE